MRRMVPLSCRLDPETLSAAELRRYLRHAGALIAASEVRTPEAARVLARARAWVAAALCGIDQALARIEREDDPP